MKKKILVSLLILGLVAGCGKVPKLANGEEAVVSFDKAENGISATELYNKIKKNYALSSLIDMIDSKILLEKYSNKKDDAKKYVDEQLTSVKNYYVDDNGKYNEESLLNTLKTYYGISTIDEFKTMLELSYYRDLAITDYAKENVTDKQIKKYYDEETVGDISAKHILISPKTKDDMTDEEKKKAEEEALKAANEVISKLNKGEKFDDLAKKYSDDESNKDKGGDLGYFNKGAMVAEFEEAAYKLKLNKYTTEPVKTKFGYHIILKTGEKEKAKLEDVKDSIINKLAEEVMSDKTFAINAMVEIRKNSGMKIEDDELAKQYSTYISNQLLQAQSSNNN